MTKITAVLAIALLASNPVFADEAGDIEQIRQKLSVLLPDVTPDSIQTSPVEGMYEVVFDMQIIYVSKDGRHLFRGDLIDVETRTNVTEATRTAARKGIMSTMDESRMVVFTPEKPTSTITVFTDVDCAYCRRLHAEIGELNSLGVKVRYLAFPRAGVDSPSYRTAVSVWCAGDPLSAMTRAKQGKSVEAKSCENPVREHMALGEQVGVSGTPAILLENGDLVPGYRPAKDLAAVALAASTAAN